VRARVGHPFHVSKNLFGLKKVRYKGMKKNHAQCQVLFALANVLLVRNRLLVRIEGLWHARILDKPAKFIETTVAITLIGAVIWMFRNCDAMLFKKPHDVFLGARCV
jgi:hypothetical protein